VGNTQDFREVGIVQPLVSQLLLYPCQPLLGRVILIIISLTLPVVLRTVRKWLDRIYFNFFQSRFLAAKFDIEGSWMLAASVITPQRSYIPCRNVN